MVLTCLESVVGLLQSEFAVSECFGKHVTGDVTAEIEEARYVRQDTRGGMATAPATPAATTHSRGHLHGHGDKHNHSQLL